MIEHINIIDVLHSQIEALLDLMQCADPDCTDVHSINTAAEMCQTMLDELMKEVEAIEEEWRNGYVRFDTDSSKKSDSGAD